MENFKSFLCLRVIRFPLFIMSIFRFAHHVPGFHSLNFLFSLLHYPRLASKFPIIINRYLHPTLFHSRPYQGKHRSVPPNPFLNHLPSANQPTNQPNTPSHKPPFPNPPNPKTRKKGPFLKSPSPPRPLPAFQSKPPPLHITAGRGEGGFGGVF